MAADIIKGHHYKATIVGYNDRNTLFIEINNKFTAYLDISDYNYSEEEINENFKIMSEIDVVVTSIDKSDCIRCKEYDSESDKKSNNKKKHSESGHLTYNLSSLLSNIKLDK